jgi:putative redox protein
VEEQVRYKNLYGETLAGTLHLPDKSSDHGIVLGHCFTCTRHTSILRRIAKDLSNAGFIVLRFDFSGNGQSQGEFTESTYSKQVTEMETAVDVIASHGATRIGMAGHSMGGSISFLTAAQNDNVKAVCTIGSRITGLKVTGFLSRTQREILEKTGEVTFTSRGRFLKITDEFFTDADRFDLPQLLQSFDKPLLMVHGDQDEIIPVREAHKAREMSNGVARLEVIAGADHMFSREEDRQAVSQLVVDWFNNQIH